MKYQIIVFGCQFNQSDSEKVASILENIGYQKASSQIEADLIVVLACSVRQSAIDRIYGLRNKFNQIRKKRPLVTVLSGCILKSDRPKMAEIFDIIFDIEDLVDLPKLLKAKSGQLKADDYFQIHSAYHSKFQAYVPIMTGCNNFCSYCVVPYTRGREVSRPAGEIIKECLDLVSRGYKLITLIGQNVNSYKSEIRNPLDFALSILLKGFARGRQRSEIRFSRLLKMIDQIPGDYWLSFATSHPKDMSDELIRAMKKAKHLIPYLHLPAQSGDNEILKKMNRRYTVAHYKSLINKVRKAVPGIMVSTDIIVGFSGETKKQFANTVKLFRAVKFDMAYIAQYSPRAGTVASKLEDAVPKEEKRKREIILTGILKKTALENNKKLIGQTYEVMVEKFKNGQCFGRTRNFKNIKFKSEVDYTGRLVSVRVAGCYEWGLSGRLERIVVILGPTACGKTKLAVRLAKKFNGEIVSADSRQVYKGMDIGTGKDLNEYIAKYKISNVKSQTNFKCQKSKLKTVKIPYHLIDVADPKDQFTLALWQKMAIEAISDIIKRGKLPIICGGTGLYISALVQGYQLSANNDQLKAIRNRLNKLTLKQLLNKLKMIDPVSYRIIDKNNRRRVQRALEIYHETGNAKSSQPKPQALPYEFLQVGLTFPRPVLCERSNKRLLHRIEKEGLIDEIKRLHRQGVSWKRLDEFGLEYRFVSKYLRHEIESKEELFQKLSSAINDFSKRQMTWFKRDKNIIWENDSSKVEKLVIDCSRKN